jgi:hypothetical protein
LIAIKVNIIDTLEANIIEFEAFTSALDQNPDDTESRKVRNPNLVTDNKNRIFGTKMRYPEKVLKEQKQHLESYFYQTMKLNKTMLPALLDPAPLLAQPEPKAMTIGGVSEAANVLQAASTYFLRHRSAQKAIRKFLYPRLDLNASLPAYECQIEDPFARGKGGGPIRFVQSFRYF